MKLLRVLQEREFERLGGTESDQGRRAADRRRRTADLEKAIAEGTFREDLYYRLNVFPIFAPPLRERKPDILLLADHFLEKYSSEHGKPHQAHLDAGHRHAGGLPLAGQRARAGEHHRARRAGVRRQRHPCPSPAADAADGRGVRHGPRMSLAEAVEAYEKDLMQDALKTTRGNGAKRRQAAQHHRAHPAATRVRKYGISAERFRG